MEIKDPGSHRPVFQDGPNLKETPKNKTRFGVPNSPLTGATSPASDTLAGVHAAYRRKDLQNPSQCELATRQALDEMLEKEFPLAESLQPAQRAQVVDWMSRDPMIQARTRAYLERTLE